MAISPRSDRFSISSSSAQPLGEIDHGGGERLPARERQQLAGEAFAAIGGVRDHLEQVDVLIPGELAPQTLHAAADDHQKVVEVVGDAAGQLSDRFQALGLPQRDLGGFAAFGLVMEAPRTLQRNADDEKKEERRRQAVDQMGRHGCEPLGPDRRAVDAGHDIDRESLELAITDPPVDRVDLGLRYGIERPVQTLGDRDAQRARWIERARTVALHGITREKGPVRADQRIETAGTASDPSVEFLEIARQHRDRDDAVERAVGRQPAAREVEEMVVERSPTRRQYLADQRALGTGRMSSKIGTIHRVDLARNGAKRTRSQRLALAIDHHDRHELGNCVDDLP